MLITELRKLNILFSHELLIKRLKHLGKTKCFILVITLFWSSNKANGQINTPTLNSEINYSWVKKYPMPDPLLLEDSISDLILLHQEYQYNHSTQEIYQRFFYYPRTSSGLKRITSYYDTYEPEYQSVNIKQVNLHRDDKVISLIETLHVEYSIEGKQIASENYDQDGRFNIYLEDAEVGDIIEMVYVTTGLAPDLHGHVSLSIFPNDANLKGKSHIRVSVPEDTPLNYKVLNDTLTPITSNSNGVKTLEFTYFGTGDNDHSILPSWYLTSPRIYFYEYSDWGTVIDINLKNFNLSEPVSKPIEYLTDSITANVTDQPEKINRILNHVQREIKYLSYGLIDPKRPETVIRQGFGDCKSKSLLTIKMLEHIGVESWPLIVNSKGLDLRVKELYSMTPFNHCVLEFVHDSDTLIFDSTTHPQKGEITDKFVSDFKYGIRIIPNQNELTLLPPHHGKKYVVELTLEPKKFNNGSHRMAEWKIDFHGDLANQYDEEFKDYGLQSIQKEFEYDLNEPHSLDELNCKFDYTSLENKPLSTFSIKSDHEISVFSTHKNNSDLLQFRPHLINEWLEIRDKSSAGEHFTLPDFHEVEFICKIPVYKGMVVKKDSISLAKDWINYSKKVELTETHIVLTYHLEILESDLSSSRYDEVKSDIEFIKTNLPFTLTNPSKINQKNQNGLLNLFKW